MGTTSKTARAAMKAGASTPGASKVVISDAELIRDLRNDRNGGLWPGTQKIDALLRDYDLACERFQENSLMHKWVVETQPELESLRKQVEDLTRELSAANAKSEGGAN